jgi:hypothetical protein
MPAHADLAIAATERYGPGACANDHSSSPALWSFMH